MILGRISIYTSPSDPSPITSSSPLKKEQHSVSLKVKRGRELTFSEHLLSDIFLLSKSHNNPIKLELLLPPPFFFYQHKGRSSWVKYLWLHSWQIVDLGFKSNSIILKPRPVFRIWWTEFKWTQASITGLLTVVGRGGNWL